MRGSTVYRGPVTGIEVQVSKQAQALIGPSRVADFVKVLTELLETIGAKRAQVSKCGWAVEIHFTWPGDGPKTWKIPVER